LNENKTFFEDFVLITPIHIRAGEVAFGTSPGDAVFMLTLRAATEKDFMMLKSMVSAIAIQTAESYKLESKISYVEEFPATVNHPDCVAILKSAAGEVIVPEGPFRWSEDFGYYGRMAPAALFGIGSGEDCPVLHSPEYSFPDEIIPKAVEVIVKTALVAGMV
ncbi:MAG: M20/M25/M40 family metallo-hydrolase, partial [Bacteroidetes bacterium]|nr:M20/M25/M40 family metallo-hydrolase [Bacteroidota bacterium]